MNYVKVNHSEASPPAAPLRLPGSRFSTLRETPVRDKSRLVFFFVLLYTLVLYARPQDMFFNYIGETPIAQISAALIAAAYVLGKLTGGLPLVKSREIGLFLGLTCWFALGLPFAFWRSGSVDVFMHTWFRTAFAFLFLTQTVTTIGRVRKLMWAIILSELIVTGYTILNQDTLQGDVRVMAQNRGLLTGNYLGIAVATTLPFTAGLLVRSRSFIQSVLLVTTFASSVWMVVLTSSRGGLLGVILSLALTWALVLRDSFRARVLGGLLVVALVGAIVLAPAVFWDRISTIWSKDYATTSANVESSSAVFSEMQRKALFWRSIEYTVTHPIFGLGMGNFAIASGTFTQNSQEWKGTHNTYTQVSSEGGIPALVLFVLLLLSSLRGLNHVARAAVGDPAREELVFFARTTSVSLYAFIFSAIFAHLAFEAHMYYLIAMSVALQTVLARSEKVALAPAANGRRGLPNGNKERGLRK